MIWLLGIGKWLKEAAAALFGLVVRYPWQAALIASLCLAAWFWRGRNEARDELAQHIAAEKAATGAQKRVNDAAETHYKEVADVADTKHEDMVANAFDVTQRFINERRVQPDRACKAPPPAADRGPVVPTEVPSNPVVAVEDADVQRCTDATVYAVGAHNWAQSLKVPENLLPAN